MDKSRVEPTILFIEKISFSLKLFSGHFYGQSFIKTVRGPLLLSLLLLLLLLSFSPLLFEPRHVLSNNLALILTSVDSGEPVQPPVKCKLRNST